MEYLEDDWGQCEVWEQVEVIKDMGALSLDFWRHIKYPQWLIA